MEVNRFRNPKLILDTSFLIQLTYPSVSLDEIYKHLGKVELYTTEGVIKELKSMAEGKRWEKARRAKMALELIKNFKVLSLKEKKVDDEILKLAEKDKFLVATNDFKLIKRLREKGIGTISIKYRKLIF